MASDSAVITTFDTNRLSEDTEIQYGKSFEQKTLGLKWKLHGDVLEISAPNITHPKITKRHVLAAMASLFDPLGYATPTIMLAKLTFSEICKNNIDWDVELTGEIQEKLLTARKDRMDSRPYSLPQYILASFCCLVAFSDASPKAYLFATYLASSDFSMHLIRAKTRMIPTKTVKIPRAKLRGALLLESCLATTIKAINQNMKPEKVYLFTDSKILLTWIRSNKFILSKSINVRIERLRQSRFSECWQYTSTEHNPSDYGTKAKDILTEKELMRWTPGPNGNIIKEALNGKVRAPKFTVHLTERKKNVLILPLSR
jgi:Pao retrotransposon peptidase